MSDAPADLSPKDLKQWLTFTELDATEARRMALALLDDRESLREREKELTEALVSIAARGCQTPFTCCEFSSTPCTACIASAALSSHSGSTEGGDDG